MLVGIRIELLQPGFDLFHQPIFWYRKVTSSITPSIPAVQRKPQSNCGNGSTPDTT
jgi:hypothetical protein